MYRYHPHYLHHRDGDELGFYRLPLWVDIIVSAVDSLHALTRYRLFSDLWEKTYRWSEKHTVTFNVPAGKDLQYRDNFYDFMGWDKWWDDESSEEED